MLLDVLQELCNGRIRRNHQPPRDGDIRISIGNPTRLRESFGMTCRIGLLQGLTATLTGRMP
jgi:UDP-glucose 4-epimerase